MIYNIDVWLWVSYDVCLGLAFLWSALFHTFSCVHNVRLRYHLAKWDYIGICKNLYLSFSLSIYLSIYLFIYSICLHAHLDNKI